MAAVEHFYHDMGTSASRGANRSAAAEPVYEANEDDYEYDEYGDAVYGDEECDEAEEDASVDPATPQSDVGPEVYWDDSSLFSCWEAAMLEYKYHHPARFEPLTTAPRSIAQKHEGAPLWYGPMPVVAQARSATPASIPSTGPKRKTKKERTQAAKRRKMSTALNLDASNPANGLLSNGTSTPVTPKSPTWTPQSPTHQRRPSFPLPPHLNLSTPLTSPPAPPRLANGRTTSIVAGPYLPAPPAFVPPPVPTTSVIQRRVYPLPPPIVPIAQGDADATDQTPEELLQDALWAWYHAGYATGLYHASMADAATTTDGKEE